ncbi:glutaredoxin domain-containing protein [Metarhizium acridum CQMa 102]|uniref:Glutaredoxin domain-containing protein n=1 Tax=Metarhizium acridum (strain CQMa 102) TaxID=655827 RepID=E9E2V0_METAQ|nr:glutaredoxin domain-containing protein [Metarhizium acridum CQMa 102]EFY89766.1 glutaredoxin domain-containing protein [Metarhizium acridum CQMa 102]
MPSPRRVRLLALAAIATVVFFLFYSSRVDPSQDSRTIQDFYHKTMDGMKKGSPPGQAIINTKTGEKAGHIPADKDADGDVDEDDRKITAEMQLRLKQAEQDAKDKANIKGGLKPDIPSEIVGKGNSAEGQPKKDKSAAADKGVAGDADKTTDKTKPKPKPKDTKKESDAEDKLSSILKMAPVVIFSKSYCRCSQTAKGILLDKYNITPVPYVVELDIHDQGASLQDVLLDKTGRKTVPNVLVNGVSIGGGDDIVELDKQNKLADKIKILGNKRVKVSERFAPDEIK